MMKSSLLFAALIVATTAGGQPAPDLVARIHFAGADRIAADPNHLAFTNEFCSAEARALESQTLDRLSRAPGAWFKAKLPAGAGDGAAQLRPLLDDLLKAEWILEIREAPGSPEYALAVRLSPERAQLWSKNLAALLQSWTGIGISPDKSGNWALQKHEPPNQVQFSRSGDWSVIDCGQGKLTLGGAIIEGAAANDGWLSVQADWPRLAQLFPALKKFDFPKIQMQAVGRGGNLQLTGNLALARPLRRQHADALVSHHNKLSLHDRGRRNHARLATLRVDHNDQIHLGVLHIHPAAAQPHLRRQVRGGVKVRRQHAVGRRGLVDHVVA